MKQAIYILLVIILFFPTRDPGTYAQTGDTVPVEDGETAQTAVKIEKAGPKRIAVVPFANKTGSEDYNLWKENLPAAVIASMKLRFEFTEASEAGPSVMKSLEEDSLNHEALDKTAEALGADIVLFGYFTLIPETETLKVTTMVYHAPLKELAPPFEISIKADSSMFASIATEAEKITANIGIPYPPEKLSASKGEHTGKVTLAWEPAKGAAGYRIYRADREGQNHAEIGETATPFFEDGECLPGKVGTYMVRAYSRYGMSRFSDPDRGFRKILPPDVSAEDRGKDSVRISWKSVEGAVKYEVFRAETKEGKYDKIGDSSSKEYHDIPEKAGVRYWYKGKSLSEGGPSDFGPSDSGFMAKPLMPYYLRGAVPGWGQIYAGNRVKGWSIAGGFTVAALGSAWYGMKFIQSKKDYDSLDSSASDGAFNDAYSRYENNAKMANLFMITAALVYLYNWVDLAFYSRADYEHVAAAPVASPGPRFHFSMERKDADSGNSVSAAVTWGF